MVCDLSFLFHISLVTKVLHLLSKFDQILHRAILRKYYCEISAINNFLKIKTAKLFNILKWCKKY